MEAAEIAEPLLDYLRKEIGEPDLSYGILPSRISGGNETDIFRANAIFRAVQVPPGKFTVRFTFRPLRGAWKEAREKLR